MKILIADKLASFIESTLKNAGHEVIVNPSLGAEDLANHISGVDILLVRSTKVSSDVIAKADILSLVIRAGAGVNTIDLQSASKRGIYVCNCPGKNTEAVAELALALLIAADRRIVFASSAMRAGKWKKKEYGKSAGLKGRNLGIIGLGSIGKALLKRAAGLDMNIVAWSRSLTQEKCEELGITYCSSLKELAEKSDAISIHLALKEETKHIINADFFSWMKDGAILVNTSRGEIIDTLALKQAIKEKNIRVALDVFEKEPTGGVADFTDTDFASTITCTPHIGASTLQASEATSEEVLKIIESYVKTGKPLHAVNQRKKTSAKYNLVVRHYNHVGVLAGVLDELRKQGVNIEEMENLIFSNGDAAACTLKLDSRPSEGTLKKIASTEFIIQVSLK